MLLIFQKEWHFLPVDNALSMKVSKTQNKFSSVETKFEIEIIKNTITQKSKDDKAFFVCSRVIGISSRSSRIVVMLAQEKCRE